MGENGQQLGFVEHEEAKIREMYDIFRAVCLQVRQDSHELRRMPTKEQEFFVKLYRTLNKMLVYMESKNVRMVDIKIEKKKENEADQDDAQEVEKEVTQKEDLMSLEQIINLPHVERHIQGQQDKINFSSKMQSHRLPELGRTTNLSIKLEDSQILTDGEIRNPMTMTFNKRSRSVAEQNLLSPELSTAKNSNTMGSRQPYLGGISKKQNRMIRRDSSLDGNFFFTAAGTKS